MTRRAWSGWHSNRTSESLMWSSGSSPVFATSFAAVYRTSWLFRVARNRITDLFRKKKPERFSDAAVANDDEESLQLEDLLPSPDAGPDALYARSLLLDELEFAIDELPDEQREVFVGHKLEGRTFKEMAAETGVSVNTLLSRKRYAVLHLRGRLQGIYDEFTKA